MIAVTEETHPGESQSNGAIERAIQSIEDQLRTLKLALESRIGKRIPMSHPVMTWLVQHSTIVPARYLEDSEGVTGYDKLRGAMPRDRIAEFGKTIM